jgi:hypothetical protein
MLPSLDPDERELLHLISIQYVVPVPFLKPVTDSLEAKRLVVLDKHGVFRVTEFGAAVMAQSKPLH